jgi:release factor glutamine methyltransferase
METAEREATIRVRDTLGAAGFIAAAEEARELVIAAGGDDRRLSAMLQRRLTGEPLAWITGHTVFCGVPLVIQRGVYAPRWQTEMLARRAARRLPANGVAVDICTGSGAVASVLHVRRPAARVLATDIDGAAVRCARVNGVDARRGDCFAPLPRRLQGCVDVVVAVVPYVPSAELQLLQRDTFTFESHRAYDGGPDGMRMLCRVMREAVTWLRPGGALLLELGGEQAAQLEAECVAAGYGNIFVLHDADGDVRGIEATRAAG